MKLMICMIFQMLIWCGYSIVLYLSHHDHSFYETILLIMFTYFNFLVTMRLSANKSFALNLTFLFLSVYMVGRVLVFHSNL